MPGSIKVSGTYRTVAAPYVKVSGTWRPTAVAYIKVSGEWKQWYASSITDDFNRTDASSLGTTSNGVTSWTATSGSWGITSNQATTSTAASSYPVATVTSALGVSDYELRIDVPSGAGQGLAFWVTDADNWWGVVTDLVTTNNYSCPAGGTLAGSTCNVTSTYAAYSNTSNCGISGSSSYTYAALANTGYTPLYSGCGGSPCAGSGTQCINHTCYSTYTYYTCNAGDGDPSGTTCTHTYSTCSSGGSDACMTCTSYSCNSGDTLSGSTCTHSSSYSATNTPSYTYFTRVVNKVSGTVSTVSSYSHTSAVRSLKVVTSNSSVTVSAYSAAAQSGLLNSNTYAATSPATTATAGMLVSPASSSQGAVLDNFYLK